MQPNFTPITSHFQPFKFCTSSVVSPSMDGCCQRRLTFPLDRWSLIVKKSKHWLVELSMSDSLVKQQPKKGKTTRMRAFLPVDGRETIN